GGETAASQALPAQVFPIFTPGTGPGSGATFTIGLSASVAATACGGGALSPPDASSGSVAAPCTAHVPPTISAAGTASSPGSPAGGGLAAVASALGCSPVSASAPDLGSALAGSADGGHRPCASPSLGKSRGSTVA